MFEVRHENLPERNVASNFVDSNEDRYSNSNDGTARNIKRSRRLSTDSEDARKWQSIVEIARSSARQNSLDNVNCAVSIRDSKRENDILQHKKIYGKRRSSQGSSTRTGTISYPNERASQETVSNFSLDEPRSRKRFSDTGLPTTVSVPMMLSRIFDNPTSKFDFFCKRTENSDAESTSRQNQPSQRSLFLEKTPSDENMINFSREELPMERTDSFRHGGQVRRGVTSKQVVSTLTGNAVVNNASNLRIQVSQQDFDRARSSSELFSSAGETGTNTEGTDVVDSLNDPRVRRRTSMDSERPASISVPIISRGMFNTRTISQHERARSQDESIQELPGLLVVDPIEDKTNAGPHCLSCQRLLLVVLILLLIAFAIVLTFLLLKEKVVIYNVVSPTASPNQTQNESSSEPSQVPFVS